MNPALLLQTLRWGVDSLIYSAEYEAYYWLKPCYSEGKRIGITTCCEYDFECDHHKKLRENLENQKIKEN